MHLLCLWKYVTQTMTLYSFCSHSWLNLSQVKSLLQYVLKRRDLSRQIPLAGKLRIPHSQHKQLHANWEYHTQHIEPHSYTGTHTLPRLVCFFFPFGKCCFSQFLYSKHNFPYLIHLLPKGHTLKIMNIKRDLCKAFSLVKGKLLWAR